MAGAAAPVAINPRLVSFLPIASMILTHQNPEGAACPPPTIEGVEAAQEIELDGQYRALREEAGFVRRGEVSFLAAQGSDAADYLQGQLTNDVEALEPGDGCYAALLDRKGHMQGDMRVLRTEGDSFLLNLEPEAMPAVLRHLSMYKIGREVEVEDVTAANALVSVIGPASSALTDTPPLSPEDAHARHEVRGVSCRVIATDGGLDLVCAPADVGELASGLAAAGVAEVSEAAVEVVRVERGRPRFGREMTTETIPQEAGINERAVSFTKGCYIGQETVARLHYKGKPNRHLRGLRSERPLEAGAEVHAGEKLVGRVGTAVLSPALGAIALAVLRREAEPGGTVTVGDGESADVVELPFAGG
jgi:folate-binding protein YgfZ